MSAACARWPAWPSSLLWAVPLPMDLSDEKGRAARPGVSPAGKSVPHGSVVRVVAPTAPRAFGLPATVRLEERPQTSILFGRLAKQGQPRPFAGREVQAALPAFRIPGRAATRPWTDRQAGAWAVRCQARHRRQS